MKRGYTGLFWQQNRGYSFFNAFLRLSLRKINILKKTKMDLRDLIEFYNRNKKTTATQFNKYFEICYKEKVKKGKKKKSAIIFFILKHVIKGFKTSKFYYQKVLV